MQIQEKEMQDYSWFSHKAPSRESIFHLSGK